jgi:hypothetical protein
MALWLTPDPASTGPADELPCPADPPASPATVAPSDPATVVPPEGPRCVEALSPRAATTAARDTRVPQLAMTTMLRARTPARVPFDMVRLGLAEHETDDAQ